MVVLLSGEHPFTYSSLHRPPREFVDLDTNRAWQEVGSSAKDLVGGLLQADEVHRLTVKEALQHEWFHGLSRMDIHKRYRRAIRDWRPRTDQSLIIDLDSLEAEVRPSTPVERGRSVLSQCSNRVARSPCGPWDGPNRSPLPMDKQTDKAAGFTLCSNCKCPILMPQLDRDRNAREMSQRQPQRKRLRRPFSPQAWTLEPALTRVH